MDSKSSLVAIQPDNLNHFNLMDNELLMKNAVQNLIQRRVMRAIEFQKIKDAEMFE